MIDEHLARRLSRLADPATRAEAAADVARHVGAEACVIVVHDPDVDALLPAAGFPQTLQGGDGWHALLDAARAPGVHRGSIAFPSAERIMPALACSRDGIAIVLIGEGCRTDCIETLDTLAPLLAGTLRGEHAVAIARGELSLAREHAARAESLALALDAARSDLERTFRELEHVSRAAHESLVRAEEAARAKDEFLAMLGHELRNPLSPIVTALQLMRLQGHPSREREVIERQVAALTRLVDDLLDVSRIARGKVELRMERCELSDLVARAVEMASPELEARRQTLTVDVPHGLVLDADRVRMAQVIANLLTNAAKYSEAGRRVRVVAERVDRMVRLRVIDEGIGIPPEMLTRVFDLFVQQQQSLDRAKGGLGLGLAIVRSFVTLHGGLVWARSDGIGTGSEFVVELPVAAERAVDEHARPPRRADRSRQRSERVLVVDDNHDAALMLSQALEVLGYDVRSAADGPSALRIAQFFHPEIALVDLGLPVMDGYELARHLRERSSVRPLRLVAVTGYGQESDKRRAAASGFDVHLTKPITLEQLEDVFDSFGDDGAPRATVEAQGPPGMAPPG